ncbi:hypothetical protein Poli38472_008764 [Pythium oligandrum]|uniref:EF-hand domain-containing protein n=1 Tax=Pythium oligandrum TaxID=41045 RepID=A0A8K1FBG8_PYTOL|nr:hypothetical protein Poli38472_008764 [Pythium oligandrum]|eukprot:TMW56116.1 hypothetical protein Poli38472_008764 [Pythium oligandrum]
MNRLRGVPSALGAQTASFFSFVNPQSLVKSHQESKIVPFSPEEMYDVVADVDQYHEFLPFCVDSKVLRRPNENVMEAALRVGFKVFTESYTSRVIMKRPEKIVIKSIESPTFKRIESEWYFKRLPDPSSCEVRFKVTFEVASFLHANAIQLFFDDVAVTQLNAFIGRTAKLQSVKARENADRRADEARMNRREVPKPASKLSSVPKAPASSTETNTESARLSPASQIAASLVRDDVWSQDYVRLKQVFEKYSDDEGKMYFSGFLKACRDLGCIYEDMKQISENSALAGAVFSSFETGTAPRDWLDLEEFSVGVYLMAKGSVEEKAHSLFKLIDRTGHGKISREDLTTAMQRRIRTVKTIFPKLLRDQLEIQMQHENVADIPASVEEAMAKGLHAIESLMEEIEQEIPLAVNQIFLEADLDQDDYITTDEWLFAWQTHPELVELMTVDGMKKVAQWASVVNPDDDNTPLDTRLTYVD